MPVKGVGRRASDRGEPKDYGGFIHVLYKSEKDEQKQQCPIELKQNCENIQGTIYNLKKNDYRYTGEVERKFTVVFKMNC